MNAILKHTLVFSLNFLLAAPLLAEESDRIQIRFDSSEADQVLLILAKRKQNLPITGADWQALFATEPYQRLKKREAAMQREFSDVDFRDFVLSDELQRNAGALTDTLAAWNKADLRACAMRVLQYLPAQATIHVKVFPEIKPIHNSFVFDTDTDPAIFLYLDPKVSPERFENTVAHEMHHIGLASAGNLYEKKIQSLPPGAQKAAEWMGAFGEGLAMLAAAGSMDTPPNQYSSPEAQQNWVVGMKNFDQDLVTVNAFFLELVDGRLKDPAATDKAYTFFGDIQGPWYTVGYRMATLVEQQFGRAALIECMLDPRLLLLRYNQAAKQINASGKDHLPLWSPSLLEAAMPTQSNSPAK